MTIKYFKPYHKVKVDKVHKFCNKLEKSAESSHKLEESEFQSVERKLDQLKIKNDE